MLSEDPQNTEDMILLGLLEPVSEGVYLQPPILKTLVPHFGQEPLVAGLPFFSFTFFGSFISTDFLHLTQYAFVRVPTVPCITSC